MNLRSDLEPIHRLGSSFNCEIYSNAIVMLKSTGEAEETMNETKEGETQHADTPRKKANRNGDVSILVACLKSRAMAVSK